jgi:hypothetical protein
MSKTVGRTGMMTRSAARIAASDAMVRPAGVSMIVKEIWLAASASMTAGNLLEWIASTPRFSSLRLRAQVASDFCGSMSMRKTLSRTDWAATASEAESVLLPEPPFCVTMATVRICDLVLLPALRVIAVPAM